jgi:hypothetical protein
MENPRQNYRPNTSSKIIVSIAMICDGISAFIFGLFYYIICGIADPIGFDLEVKEALVRQGTLVAFLFFCILILCVIALIFWKKGHGFWRYVILVIGFAHLAGSIYLFTFRNEFPFFAYYLYLSVFLNPVLVITIILDWGRAKRFHPEQTTS